MSNKMFFSDVNEIKFDSGISTIIMQRTGSENEI